LGIGCAIRGNAIVETQKCSFLAKCIFCAQPSYLKRTWAEFCAQKMGFTFVKPIFEFLEVSSGFEPL
jgi:hypothetical protein